MPAPKSKAICNQCRARKVRCSGGPSPCVGCTRLEFECSFDDATAGTTGSSTLPKRRRPQACFECRATKVKCSGHLPCCETCQINGKTCTYGRARKSKRLPASSSPASNEAGSCSSRQNIGLTSDSQHMADSAISDTQSQYLLNPSPVGLSGVPSASRPSIATSRGGESVASLPTTLRLHDRLHLVVDFFRHLHPLPVFAFLYEEATVQRCLEESLDQALLYAICALTAATLEYAEYYPEPANAWVAKAEDLIWVGLDSPTIFKVQALVLIVHYHVLTGNFPRAFILHPLAVRSATALRLTYERSDISPVAQDIRRRLMWSVAMLDDYMAVGLPECELCPYENVHLKLPGSEDAFHADAMTEPEVTSSQTEAHGVPDNNLLSVAIRQAQIRRDLLRLRRRLDSTTGPVPELTSLVDDFATTLGRHLPRHYTTEEMRKYARSRWLIRYTVVHLSWHQCYCDAYRLFLPGYKEAAPAKILKDVPETYIAEAAATCMMHALEILRILRDLDSMRQALQAYSLDISVCGYHAARLILFISRSPFNPAGDGPTEATALAHATTILEILERMHSSAAFNRLVTAEIKKMILNFSFGQVSRSQESSDGEDMNHNRGGRYGNTAKQRQSLGIHSILRQSRFRDDSAAAAQRSIHDRTSQTEVAMASPPNALPAQLPLAPQSDWRMFGNTLEADPWQPLGGNLNKDTSQWAGMIPQDTLECDSYAVDPWTTMWHGPGPLQTDEDYF